MGVFCFRTVTIRNNEETYSHPKFIRPEAGIPEFKYFHIFTESWVVWHGQLNGGWKKPPPAAGTHPSGIRNSDFENSRIQKFSTVHRFLSSFTQAFRWRMTNHPPGVRSHPPGFQNSGIQFFFSTFAHSWVVWHGKFDGGWENICPESGIPEFKNFQLFIDS